MRRTALLVALSCFVSPTLSSQESSSTVMTSGYGSVSLTPRRATLQIIVATRATTASEASALNSAKVDSVHRALAGWQTVSDSIRITHVTVAPNENYQEGLIIDYEASANVQVVVLALDSIGAVFDRALRNGASQIGRLAYSADSTIQARKEAMQLAFKAAEADAAAIASAAGLNLGKLIEVRTDGGGQIVGYNPLAPRSFQVEAITISPTPSDVVVTAFLTVQWELIE